MIELVSSTNEQYLLLIDYRDGYPGALYVCSFLLQQLAVWLH